MKLIHFIVYILINLLFVFLISYLDLKFYIESVLIVLVNAFIFFFIQKQTVSEVEYIAKNTINFEQNELENESINDDYIFGINNLKSLFEKINNDIKKFSKESQKPLTTSIEAILNSTNDGIIVVNNDRDIIMANDSFFTLCGYRAYEISGKDSTTMIAPENVLSKSLVRFIKYSFENVEKNSTNISTGTIEINNKSSKKTLKATANTLRYTSNSIDGLVINLKDITKELEANEEKNKFVTNISHEFRTPLFSIMGYSSLINEDEELDKEIVKSFGETIYNESIRLSDIIDNLLNVLTLDKSDSNMIIEKINVEELLTLVIKEYEQKIKLSNLDVGLDLQGEDFNIVNNKESLSNIFNNIFSNSVKFADKSTKITVIIKKYNNSIKISFTNIGVSIPDEHKSKIFQRFYRVEDNIHKIPGAGLGLFISQKIAHLHGGNISFESDNNITTFTVELPNISKYDKEGFNYAPKEGEVEKTKVSF
ncbi:MAG: ATP-binding protein [Candidatus Sericytochromatia bacterium]